MTDGSERSAHSCAQGRINEVRRSLTLEASGVHTAMLLVRTLEADRDEDKKRILLLFGSYIGPGPPGVVKRP
jgi:hypothetical protein